MQSDPPQSTLSTFRFEGVRLRHWVSGVGGSQSTISTFTFSKVYRKFLHLCKVSNPNQRYLRSVLKGFDWDIEWGGVLDPPHLPYLRSLFRRYIGNFWPVQSDSPQSTLSTFRFEGVRLRYWVSGVGGSQSTISTFTFSKVHRKFLHLCKVSNPNQRYLRSVLKGLVWDTEWVEGVWSQSTLSTFTFSKGLDWNIE